MTSPIELPNVILTRDVGSAAIRLALKSGEYTRIRRGVSGPVPDAALSPWERDRQRHLTSIAAAASALAVRFAYSHTSAGLIHDLELPPWDGRAHVIQHHRRGHWRVDGLHNHWAPVWSDDDVVEIDGVLVTSLPRTIIDCIMTLRPDYALGVGDSGLRKLADVTRFDQQESRVREHKARELLTALVAGRARGKGVVQAREIVAQLTGFSESMSESRLRWVPLAGGAPAPQCQLPVTTRDGLRYPDLAWRICDLTGDLDDPRIIAEEFDGVDKYAPADGQRPAAVVNAQARRDESLRLAGVDVRHRSAVDLQRPGVLFAEMISRFPPGSLPPLQPRPGLAIRPSRTVAARRRT